MTSISTLSSLNTYNSLKKQLKIQKENIEELSTGERVSKAADDAAGLAISQKLLSQINGSEQAARNIQDSNSLLQTAEGGMGEITDILQRMRELTIQGANDTLTENDKGEIIGELQELQKEIERISQQTTFNQMPLIDGTFSQKAEEVAGEEDTALSVPSDGSIITKKVDIGDFKVDFNFRKISSEEVEIKVTHDGKILGEKIINQDPLKWEKSFGGSLFDSAEDIVQTDDGGYLVVGRTMSEDGDIDDKNSNDSDIWAIKLDQTGQNIEWQKTIGQSGYDEGISVDQAENGDILISSTITNRDPYTDITAEKSRYIVDRDRDLRVFRLNSNTGSQKNSITLGGGSDEGRVVTATSDGGYILGANSTSTNREDDMLLMKFDQDGNFEWESYAGENNGYDDNINDIQEVFNNQGDSKGYIVTGDNGYSDITYKVNSEGSVEWSKSYSADTFNSIRQTFNSESGETDGYIATGENNNQNKIVKIKDNGDKDWTLEIGDSSYLDQGTEVEQVFKADGSKNGYIISGVKNSIDGDEDLSAIKIDDSGNIEWQLADSTFGSNGDEADLFDGEVQTTKDEGYLVADPSDNDKDNLIYKFDKYGSYSWHHKFAKNDKIKSVSENQSEIIVNGENDAGENWISELNSDGSQLVKFTLPLGTDFKEIENIEKTEDDGYLISGTDSDDNKTIAKIAADHSLSWQRDLTNRDDQAAIIERLHSGNYLLAANKEYLDGNERGSIIELDESGEIISENIYDDLIFNENDLFKEINGQKLITAKSRASANQQLIALSADGSVESQFEFAAEINNINNLEVDSSANYLISAENTAGETVISSINSADLTENWRQTINSSETFTTSDGGYLELTQAADTAVGSAAQLTKIDSDGNTVEFEDQEFGTEDFVVKDIIQHEDQDGNIVYTAVGAENNESKIYQLDSIGENPEVIDSSAYNLSQIDKIEEISDGFLLTGKNKSNGEQTMIKTDAVFEMEGSVSLAAADFHHIAEIRKVSTDKYRLTGNSNSGELVNLETSSTEINNDQSFIMNTETVNSDVEASAKNFNEKIWDLEDKNLGGTGENARLVKATSDGGYLVSNSVRQGEDDEAINSLVKYDSLGKIEWENSPGDFRHDWLAQDIFETEDSYFTAKMESSGYQRITQFNKEDGTEGWSEVVKSGQVESLTKNEDGGYLVGIKDLGYRKLLKIYSSGDSGWSLRLDNRDDFASSIKETADGGYIISGTKEYNNGDQDANLVKINASGEMEWEKSLTGSSESDSSSSVEVVNEGGEEYYLVSGTRDGSSWVTKIASDGSQEWNQTYNGIEGTDIDVDANGDYLLSGTEITNDADKNATVTKINAADGSKVWQESYGGGDDSAGVIKETHDGGYIISGTKTSNRGDTDKIIVKLDENGERVWERTFDNLELDDQGFGVEESIVYDSEGDHEVTYAITGTTKSESDSDIWMMRLNDDGTDNWTAAKTFGGSGNDEAANIQWTDRGTYIISGTQTTAAGDTDIFAAEIKRSDGSILWEKSIGGSGDEEAGKIIQTEDKGYLITGSSNSTDFDSNQNNGGQDLLLAKLDYSGEVQWTDLLGGSGNDYGKSITEIAEGNYVVAGSTGSGDDDPTNLDGDVSFNNGISDTWVLNYSQGETSVNLFPENKATTDPEYGRGTTTLDLDRVEIDFNWKDFEVGSIKADGKQETKANFVTQSDHTANVSNHLWAEIDNLTSSELGLDKGVWADSDNFDFDKSISILDNSLSKVSTARSKVGSYQNRLDHSYNNVTNSVQNLKTANSRIVDADMAKKQMELTRSQILSQSANAMLAQARNQGQNILQLFN
jgi:flagellin-like hook-associated protein FlgL